MDIQILKKYEEKGLLRSQSHPKLPLLIWCYTNSCQYEQAWDEITLSCRGLITDLEGNIVSRGFKKFFNYEENRTNIPSDFMENSIITEKLDGSYIGLFYYQGEWIINSKGSFSSDQSRKATELFNSKYLDYKHLSIELTHCFEIIYPENRIVVDYGIEEKLVYLSSFDREGLESQAKTTLPKVGVEYIPFQYEKLKLLDKDNKEGYVIKFSNGERCKIKFENYIYLHRIMTQTSSYRIWESLKDNISIEQVIENTPDEFYSWVKECKAEILENYYRIEAEINNEFINLLDKDFETRKDFAIFVKDNCKYPSQIFALKDGKAIDRAIWDMVKPELKYPFEHEYQDN